MSSLSLQSSALTLLQRYGTLTTYPRPPPGSSKSLSLVAFADAGHTEESSQLCFIVGLVLGKIERGSEFHLLSWSPHRSRRPVKSTAAAEILAAGEALDEIVTLKDVLTHVWDVNLRLIVLVDTA